MFQRMLREAALRDGEDGAGAGAGSSGAGQGQGNGAAAPGEGPDYGKWAESLPDAELKGYATRHKSFEDLLRSDKQARAELADRIRLPGPNATAEDMQKFRRGLGVPDDLKGYEVKLPEGIQTSEADETFINLAREIAHDPKVNLNKHGFNEFVSRFVTKAKEIEAASEKAIKEASEAAQAALKKEWSTEYDKKRELAFRTGRVHGGDDLAKAMETATIDIDGFYGKLGDYPPFLKFLASMGAKADEADLALGDGASGAGKQTAQAELNQLLAANPPGSDGYKKNQARIQELYGIIHGTKPIVGAGGRTT